MKRYYMCSSTWTNSPKGNGAGYTFKNLIIQKPNPNNPSLLIEKCIWCNDNEDVCGECKQWTEEINDLTNNHMSFVELKEEDVFLELMEEEPFKD